MPRTETIDGPAWLSTRRTMRWLCLLVFLAGVAQLSATITSIQQFWDLPAEQKTQPADFELACTVTYFDPDWRILFIEDDEGGVAYVPYGDNSYPFKAGEAITVRGQFPAHGIDISFEHATVQPRVATTPVRPPRDVSTLLRDHAKFRNYLVKLEGVADNVRRTDDRHVQFLLSTVGGSAYGWLLVDPKAPTPDLTDRRVRIVGVYNPKVAPDGQLSSLEIMVAGVSQVEPLGRIEDDPGFKLPITSINELPKLAGDHPVHVAGRVVAREPGHYVRIRDSGGQVDVMTGQMRSVAIGESVDAVGYPAVSGFDWRLQNAIFFTRADSLGPNVTNARTAGAIGLAADVLKLSVEEAAQSRPVWLTGVVTWSHQKAPFFFIHDSSGGVCVMRGATTGRVSAPGRYVEVHGVSGMGAFAPVVVASKFERVGEAVLPIARLVSVEHAMTGVEEAQWVEMRGYLRRIYREGDWNYLELATATSDFTAVVPPGDDLSPMVGSFIRLHGVCTADADSRRKLTGIKLWVPGAAYVQVEEPAPKDPFSVSARSLSSLGQYETVQAFNRRVRVSGVVLRQYLGHWISIAENGHSLLVMSRDQTPARPGDQIEAVGLLGRQGGRITLSEAVYRVTGHGAEPVPQTVEPAEAPVGALDGQLVTIKGTLLSGTVVDGFAQLTIRTPQKIFEATMEMKAGEFIMPQIGSQLAVTGVYMIGYDERSVPDSFVMRLRSPADVVVLETPSWFTRGRILAFTGVLALGALLFLVWITGLRRQVQRQTGLIRAQVERESKLQSELARASKLESLGLLAGGIAHDFNNLLTVLIGNMSLIRLDAKLGGDALQSLTQAEKAAARARDLTQQLLTFAKGGAPLRAAVSLPEVVREVAEFALRGAKVRCEFDLPAGLWPANVDKGQIGQVVQNIVINALQAMPDGGLIRIALANHEVDAELAGVLAPGRYVRLDFADQGPGIAPADLLRIFDPYFTTKQKGSGLGLATVHSIVKKHGGHVTAESKLGEGTTFHVWVPAAEASLPPRKGTVPPMPAPVAAPSAARVLIMDDEDFIRDLGCSILRRYGYHAHAVADGNAAITEYARARQAGQPYQLVILDLTIPGGMGGKQTMEELLKLDPAVRAIVSSGYSNDLVLSNYQAHGFRGMVSKPYDVADFAHTVERVLTGERA